MQLGGLLPAAITFQMYRKLASLAVATVRPAFRVARFRADRTFSLLSTNSARGTLMAEPSFSLSRSLRMVATICLCFPCRPCGTLDLRHRLEMGWSFVGLRTHTCLRESISLKIRSANRIST